MNLIKYLHPSCFSPVPSTFKQAIKKGFLQSWPGLTTKMVDKYLPPSEATAKGHIRQERQHLQSTKSNKTTNKHPIHILCEKTAALSLNQIPKPSSLSTQNNKEPYMNNKKHNSVAYILIDHDEMVAGYMDLTGRFPQRSSRGNNYILVGYHYDADAILAKPIKDRTANVITDAWRSMHESFEQSGQEPTIYILDNEKSKVLTDMFLSKGVKYQLASPNNHRTILAERSIQTYKSHFKAGLATCDPTFPLSEWDRLVEQSVITLNLLRPSRANPNISAYQFLFGHFDFKSTPLAPPGIKIVAHSKPATRGSWELQGENGFYVGPALMHYRCIKCYFPKHRSERVCDTVEFIPHVVPVPETNLEDFLRQAAGDIVHLLTQPPSNLYPSLKAGDPIRNTLVELSTQLGSITSLTPTETVKPNSSPKKRTASPRVVQTTSPPRVRAHSGTSSTTMLKNKQSDGVSVEMLENHGRLPKNNRYDNTIKHRYPLRSLNLTASNSNTAHSEDACIMHIFTPEGNRMSMDNLLAGPDSAIWERSLSNEWGRLASGNKYGTKGTKTIAFISRSEVPHGRDVTYATFVCDFKPLKKEQYRVRITVGGDRLHCPDDTGSPAANLLETKLLLNSTISDVSHGARFFTCDITN